MMPSIQVFDAQAAIPGDLERQVRTALALQWPGPDSLDPTDPLIDPDLNPTYFVLADEGSLLGYARTIWARVTVRGYDLRMYGLGDVVTIPEHRSKGYGSRVLRAATAHIVADPEADAAILLTEPELERFYGQCGWVHVPGLRVATEEAESAFVMTLLLSPRAKTVCSAMGQEALALPGDEW